MEMKEARVYTKVATGGVIDDDSTESLMLTKERRNDNVDTFNPKAMTGFVSPATFQRTAKFCERWKVS